MTARAIPEIALREFTTRRKKLRQAVDNGDWAGDPANQAARLWLAIAIAAGAGPRLPQDVKNQIEVTLFFPPGKRRLPRAEEIADPVDYLHELARARDVAIDRAGPDVSSERLQRAFDLDAMSEALGAPARDYSPREQRNAA